MRVRLDWSERDRVSERENRGTDCGHKDGQGAVDTNECVLWAIVGSEERVEM